MTSTIAPAPCCNKVLLLGLGNDILSDDAIGLFIARELRSRLTALNQVDILETCEMGLSLLDYVIGYETVILLDAVQTGQNPPGHLCEFDSRNLPVLPSVAPHFLGIGEMLALGRQLGLAVPSKIRILAIEVDDPFTVGIGLTPDLQRALPSLVDRAAQIVLCELADGPAGVEAFRCRASSVPQDPKPGNR